jgi:hypothetical protein
MKVILLSIAMFSLTLVANAQESSKSEAKTKKEASAKKKKSAITFKTLLIERNAIPYDSQELFKFEFKNTGKTPLLIQNVATTCGCTTAEKPSEPIQPGKTGVISVKYDTKRVGDLNKTITVTTNVQTEPILLVIKGKILPAAPAEPAKN